MATAKMQTRQAIYARAGVPEYGVVEPRTRTLSYDRLAAEGTYEEAQVFTEDATITFACLPAVPLTVADLFADAPDTTIQVQPLHE
jgi:Uma2 family endonuclease